MFIELKSHATKEKIILNTNYIFTIKKSKINEDVVLIEFTDGYIGEYDCPYHIVYGILRHQMRTVDD